MMLKEFLFLRIIINPSKKPQPQHFPRNYLWIIMTKEHNQKCVTTIRRPVAFNHKFKHFNIIYIEHVICIQRTVHVNCCHKCLDKCIFFVPFSFEQTTNAKKIKSQFHRENERGHLAAFKSQVRFCYRHILWSYCRTIVETGCHHHRFRNIFLFIITVFVQTI